MKVTLKIGGISTLAMTNIFIDHDSTIVPPSKAEFSDHH